MNFEQNTEDGCKLELIACNYELQVQPPKVKLAAELWPSRLRSNPARTMRPLLRPTKHRAAAMILASKEEVGKIVHLDTFFRATASSFCKRALLSWLSLVWFSLVSSSSIQFSLV